MLPTDERRIGDLDAAASREPQAAAELLPLVYDELRKLAASKLIHEKPGQTLQATALVHEAYLRLVGGGARGSGLGVEGSRSDQSPRAPSPQPLAPSFDSRGHFFASAAKAMRRILIENARRTKSLKRGGGLARVDLTQVVEQQAAKTLDPEPSDQLALDEALAKLERNDSQAAAVARLRLLAGLSADEAAAALGTSQTTAFRDWTYAKAFLQAELGG
jgi:DNA-directed RNA polymerase specialized sigma24 family protein